MTLPQTSSKDYQPDIKRTVQEMRKLSEEDMILVLSKYMDDVYKARCSEMEQLFKELEKGMVYNYGKVKFLDREELEELRKKYLAKKEDKPKVVILDNNPLSIACYMEEHPEFSFEEKEGEKNA